MYCIKIKEGNYMKIFIILLCFVLVGCSKQEIENKIDNNESIQEKNMYTIEKELLYGEPLKNYKEEFKNIIDAVKVKYPDFKEEDYLVYYLNHTHIESSQSFRQIEFTYAIDGYIVTNSSITVFYENGEITSIGDSSVQIKEVELNKINNSIKEFESNKKEIISKKIPDLYKEEVILNSDYTLSNEGLSDNILEFKEFYKYDYNTDKLKYEIEITKFNIKIPEVTYMDVREIVLN